MAGVCTNAVRRSGTGCDHRDITVNLDGTTIILDIGERELDAMPWADEDKKQLVLLGLKRLRASGLSLDDIIGRITNGDEATNVKEYGIITKDITKTNIGTSYVNVPVGANGERSFVDLTGCTQYRIVLHANLVGTGPFGFRLVRDSDNAVIYENASIAQTGERELDTDWQPIPGGIVKDFILVRLQAKSTVAADDPVVRRCIVFVR